MAHTLRVSRECLACAQHGAYHSMENICGSESLMNSLSPAEPRRIKRRTASIDQADRLASATFDRFPSGTGVHQSQQVLAQNVRHDHSWHYAHLGARTSAVAGQRYLSQQNYNQQFLPQKPQRIQLQQNEQANSHHELSKLKRLCWLLVYIL